ncbi:hypothetical protein [Rehaibacterium terrae]|jgi:hypothetical protein|uniref:Uncharacterized protein n=1 Tax=Rehaibacterium terrae TaxID=1341696 RepID=A0A7W7XZS8_9GAMM|nr:hypothetical protein [Rehaibacterium terrae]MBB5015476.1 hypothetical protein [Rehaibacterium terrae]
MSDTRLSCFGALALELTPGALAGRLALPQDQARELGALVASDLLKLVPEVAALDLAFVAAHFDPAELLRPGWPRHAGLVELAQGAPGRRDEARVIAFGSHDGRLPEVLAPDENLVGGPLRLLPFVAVGDEAIATTVGHAFEERLLDTGMAGADTALYAQTAFGAQVEHARYLTVHDLCALTAVQYEHAGLKPLWPLIEAALLAPEGEEWLDAPPEPLARYAAQQVRFAMLDIDAWAEGGFAPAGIDAERMPHAFDQFTMRQRQFAAVLAAHGIAVVFDHAPAGHDPRALLRG